MIIESIWLTKLVLSHLVTDFILQPKSWVEDRYKKHFSSPKLYLHGLVTALLAFVVIGWQYWPVALVILLTHIVIDGWKSYQQQTVGWFLLDQFLHLFVIAACWYVAFIHWKDVKYAWEQVNAYPNIWLTATAFIFLTTPAGIMIGQFTRQWREKIADINTDTESLANAGKWIGIAERVIILIFVLQNQYAAIGLLVAAKGIIRFNEKDRQEIKTEYLVVGTLISICLAVVTGLLIKII
jgi:uncharacterized membrane protein YidH (DUF202 family)